MPITLELLLRPVSTKRLPVGPDGVPRIRDTGIRAADISFEIGPRGLGDDEILTTHPELDSDDLDAVRAHQDTRTEFEALLDRVYGDDPTPADVLAAYLFLPYIIFGRYYDDAADDYTNIRVRSSFEAAITDAAKCKEHGIHWLEAVGNLVLFDQIGTALTLTNRPPSSTTALERALEQFSDAPANERAALYALRNALAHDFGLANRSEASNRLRRQQLTHAFTLDLEGDGPLITFPATPWDGDVNSIRTTTVNLERLAQLTAEVRIRILACYGGNTLRLALSPEETRRRYIFTHGPTDEDVMAQHKLVQAARWGIR